MWLVLYPEMMDGVRNRKDRATRPQAAASAAMDVRPEQVVDIREDAVELHLRALGLFALELSILYIAFFGLLTWPYAGGGLGRSGVGFRGRVGRALVLAAQEEVGASSRD
jgi:hypothetical protein